MIKNKILTFSQFINENATGAIAASGLGLTGWLGKEVFFYVSPQNTGEYVKVTIEEISFENVEGTPTMSIDSNMGLITFEPAKKGGENLYNVFYLGDLDVVDDKLKWRYNQLFADALRNAYTAKISAKK